MRIKTFKFRIKSSMGILQGELAILLFSRQKICLSMLIELWVMDWIMTLWVSCVQLTYFTTLQAFRVSVRVSTVKNKGFVQEETCFWRKTNLTTWKRWHTGSDTTFACTTTGSNDWTDLQIRPMIVFNWNVTSKIMDRRFRRVKCKFK